MQNHKTLAFGDIHNNAIIAANIEKTDKLYRDIGLQLSKLNTVICFDNKADMLADTGVQFSQSIYDTVICYGNSVAYSTHNVKHFGAKKLN